MGKREETISMRCDDPGWAQLSVPDGRRGLWMRAAKGAIELCAGREGDDVYLELKVGHTIIAADVAKARECLEYLAYAHELASSDVISALGLAKRVETLRELEREDDG